MQFINIKNLNIKQNLWNFSLFKRPFKSYESGFFKLFFNILKERKRLCYLGNNDRVIKFSFVIFKEN